MVPVNVTSGVVPVMVTAGVTVWELLTVHDVPDPAVIKVFVATPAPLTIIPIATVPDTKLLIVSVVPAMVPVNVALGVVPAMVTAGVTVWELFTVHVPDPAVIKVFLATPVPVTCMSIATVPDTKVLIVRVVPTMVPVKMACVAAPVLKAHVFVIVLK